VKLEDALVQPGSCANPDERPLNPAFNGNGISLEGRTDGKHIHHITVSNCEIFECGGGGIGSMEADYITIENNLIYNNCWYTIFGTSGISNLNSWNYDDHTEKEYSMIIRNNILFGNQLFVPWIGPCKIYDGNGIIIDSEYNEDRSFEAYSGKTRIENNVVFNNGGRGIHVYKSANVDIINNTCYFNGKSPELDDGEITVQNAANIRIFNNIMYARTNERANLRYQSPQNIEFGHNLIYNASSGKISFRNETDIVYQNPEFLDADLAMPDLRLKETSPARNAGTSIPGLYSNFDINGISRMAGGASDIGAYEFDEEIINRVNRLQNSGKIEVFPNPAKDFIQLRFMGKNLESRLNYSLADIQGKIISDGQLKQVSQTSGELFFALPNTNNGIYILKVWNEEERFVHKILINN
jgi:parallel beta-helix repeat protein